MSPIPKTHRKARRDYGGVPSVTEVISAQCGWKTNALIGWAHKLGKEGRSTRERDAAADMGSCCHAVVASAFVEAGGEPFDEAEWLPKVGQDGVDRCRANAAFILARIRAMDWTVVACELAVVGPHYAGTIDLVVRTREGVYMIVDLKTGKGAYDETILQLGAYAGLWRVHLARRGDAVPIPQYQPDGAILHAPMDGEHRVIPVDAAQMVAGEHAFGKFLDVHEVRSQLRLRTDSMGGILNNDKDGAP